MYTIFFTAVSILIPSHNFNCETEIYYRFNSYIEESGKTYYEMYNCFDNDENTCIDYYEINTLLKKLEYHRVVDGFNIQSIILMFLRRTIVYNGMNLKQFCVIPKIKRLHCNICESWGYFYTSLLVHIH